MVEFINKIRSQLNVLFGDMQPHQKVTLVTLGLMVMVPFGMLIFGEEDGGKVPLQYGAAFDSIVQAQAEEALLERGLSDFESVGRRILAPASKVEEYNGALLAAGISSPYVVNELESTLKPINPFTPQHEFKARMDSHLSSKIRNSLRAIDGISDALVIWSKPEGRSRWDRSGGVKASVHVTPEGGRELPRRLVESLRNSVATMVPDLERENVVVIDRSTGKSWAGNDPDDPFDNKLEELKRSRVQFHQNRIQEALNEIAPNAVVAVNVEFDDIMSTRERSQQIDKGAVELTSIQEIAESTSSQGTPSGVPGTASNQPRNLASSTAKQGSSNDKEQRTKSFSVPSMTILDIERTPLNEKSLQVAVSIPEGHIEQLVLSNGVPLGTTDQEKATFRKAVEEESVQFTAKVKRIVAKMIPPNPPNLPEDAVEVTTHRRIEPEPPQVNLPVTDMLKDFLSTWGSSIALTLFGLWALMLLKKSMPVSEAAPSAGALDKLTETVAAVAADAAAAESEAESEAAAQTQNLTSRDTLEMAVDNDPAVAAAIISKWLQNA